MTTTSVAKVTPVTTGRTDLITMLAGTWLMIGLFLDGYAHTNLIDELESFFTPWHGVFYSGFLASAGWVVWIIYRNMEKGRSWREAIPAGYGPTVFGLTLFGLGGIGDGVWHTIFGIESGIDALLSPTHFMLFTGGLLGLSTAIRSTRLRNAEDSVTGSDKAPLLLSILLVTAAMAFFGAYMWIPGQPLLLGIPFEEAQGAVGFYISGILVSTAVLLSPALIILRWWRPPFGTFLLIWVIVNGAIAISFDFDLTVALAFGLAGGLAGEVLVLVLTPGPARRTASLITLAITPVIAWSAYLIAFTMGNELLWPPEIWAGSIVLSGLAAAGLGWIGLPDTERGPVPSSL